MQDSSEVVVGANGSVYTAPYSDTLAYPDDVATALASPWVEHGFVSEDGVTLRDSKEIEDIEAWQSFYPIRKIISSKSSGIECVLRQFNPDNVQLAFGGGEISTATGVATYIPPG